ncbi:MAG: helix-turn-helix transcriptional regulator, partial [Planctomycetes bacterium]|nr:helix-turn-helix transcriptional regulator [Planctomycetota bacterium]
FALELLGDRWTLLVVRDLVFFGKRRFSEFRDSPEGVATNVLSNRLQRLLDAGVIGCEQDPDDGRQILYRLIEAGRDLVPALLELARWGGRHGPRAAASPQLLERLEKDRDGLMAEILARLDEG